MMGDRIWKTNFCLFLKAWTAHILENILTTLPTKARISPIKTLRLINSWLAILLSNCSTLVSKVVIWPESFLSKIFISPLTSVNSIFKSEMSSLIADALFNISFWSLLISLRISARSTPRLGKRRRPYPKGYPYAKRYPLGLGPHPSRSISTEWLVIIIFYCLISLNI